MAVQITAKRLETLGVGFKATFQGAFDSVAPDYRPFTMEVPSSTGKEEYGWLGKLPGMREWIGDRVVHRVSQGGYEIRNRDFELTVGVDRNDIEDDNLGLYAPLMSHLGQSAAEHPGLLVYALLQAGFTTRCYDGQFFFDANHPVVDAAGATTLVSNTGGGSGQAWYLFDTTRAIKPIILQKRKAPNFVSKTSPTDDNVFNAKEFIWGVDDRKNVGFGLWQLAYGSRQPLNAATYAVARAALMGMRADHGGMLGIRPNLLVVPGTLESAARKILMNEQAAGGESNEWKGTAQLLVSPWLG